MLSWAIRVRSSWKQIKGPKTLARSRFSRIGRFLSNDWSKTWVSQESGRVARTTSPEGPPSASEETGGGGGGLVGWIGGFEVMTSTSEVGRSWGQNGELYTSTTACLWATTVSSFISNTFQVSSLFCLRLSFTDCPPAIPVPSVIWMPMIRYIMREPRVLLTCYESLGTE